MQSPGIAKKKLGLDRPCRLCDQTMYFGYSGPLEGVCGRCTDTLKGALGGGLRRQANVVVRAKNRGVGGVAFGLFFLGVVAGLVAAQFLHGILPF